MKNSWLVYVTVAVVSALAGVAIAGPPNTVGTDATIVVPATTTTTTTTSTPELEPEPAATEPQATVTTTTGPADTTTTTSTTTTTTEPVPEIDRAAVEVVAVNGASIGGLATRIRDELRDLGFDRARATDGTAIVDETVVYFMAGFAAEAAAVAEALGLELGDLMPVEDAPPFGLNDEVQVAVYLGRDNA